MAEDELKFRISAHSRDAEQALERTSQRQKELGRVTDKTGDVAERSAAQTRELNRATERAGDKTSGAARRVSGLRGQLSNLSA